LSDSSLTGIFENLSISSAVPRGGGCGTKI
jgi:hypothetical protein